MRSLIRKESLESGFIQTLKVIFKEKSAIGIKSISKKSKENRLKKNELDYFEYTYISDSAF